MRFGMIIIKEMIKVSIVIPVYNAEKYLGRCIESLLAQNVECELIFVNDGSKDGSQKIIEQYREKDRRVVLVNQPNGGVSAARNTGIAAAKGEYLGFVDADDYIESDMYEQLYGAASSFDTDIVISNFFYEQGNTKSVTSFEFPKETLLTKNFIADEIFEYFIKKELLNSACNKIFRREFIEKYNIRFPEKVALGEDSVFNMRAFAVCENAVCIDYAGYHYQEVEGSATRDVTKADYFKRIVDAKRFDYRSILPLKMDQPAYEKLKAQKFISSVLSLVHLYFNAPGIGLGQKIKLIRQMIQSDEVVETLAKYYDELIASYDRYSQFLLKCIKKQDIYRLFFAAFYSKIRNRS